MKHVTKYMDFAICVMTDTGGTCANMNAMKAAM